MSYNGKKLIEFMLQNKYGFSVEVDEAQDNKPYILSCALCDSSGSPTFYNVNLDDDIMCKDIYNKFIKTGEN
jgi:hypothetical protein